MRKPLILCAALSLAASVAAVEVSLEENKAERGNIGYIDLQRLFKLYPETLKARQNFEEVVRQAEDQVNLRKAELIGLRAELARLKMERDFMGKTPIAIRAEESPLVLPGMPLPGVPPPTEASTAAAEGTLHASEIAVSTTAPLILALPGSVPEIVTVQPPGASTTTAKTPLATGAAGLERRLEEKTRQVADKEAEFKTYQAQVEKNLLDLEGRRTEILLGKIYGAVQEIARAEGISVVVDKSHILFGHKAVDLTEQVLQRLKGS